MSYTLIIGDYAYSSWSLRGWLTMHRFGLPMQTRLIDFADTSVADQLAQTPPARTVPTLILSDGTPIWDSLALAEELASRHPEAGLWPQTPQARAVARAVTAEMHSGFGALRSACPMNLRSAYSGVVPSTEVRADLDRIETLWVYARDRFGAADSPWLFGAYSIADAFYAPVAARIAGYGLSVGAQAQAYVAAHLADGAFRRWRAMGLVRGQTLSWYAQSHNTAPWPGPAPEAAQSTDQGPSVNAQCPYSGRDVQHFMTFRGQTWGFCNAFCRDKTVADPLAWPAFVQMVEAG